MSQCQFADDPCRTNHRGLPVFACVACGKATTNRDTRSQCGLKTGPRALSDVNCVHLKAITTGETPACCGGTAMIDVGRCEIKGIVTLQGRVVGNATTAACLNCRSIQAKE